VVKLTYNVQLVNYRWS